MFVFAGLQVDKSDHDLVILMDRLHKSFAEEQLSVSFAKKDNLLISRFDDVSFYVSIFSKKKELKDWFQMAEDFELTAYPNPVSASDLEERLTQKKVQSPELYKDTHYLIARNVFAEMDDLNLSQIYVFL